MKICHEHYYCNCTKQQKECHYCRKKQTFYKEHYICLECCRGWKTQKEYILEEDGEGAQLRKVRDVNDTKIANCICGKFAIRVGRDYRVPKRTDIKEWNKLKNEYHTFYKNNPKSDRDETHFAFSRLMIDKYTYSCGGAYFCTGDTLYEKRNKNS